MTAGADFRRVPRVRLWFALFLLAVLTGFLAVRRSLAPSDSWSGATS